MYDFYDAVGKRYDNIYSLGGPVQRSFFQNVGKVVNKNLEEKTDTTYNEIYKNTESILRGEYYDRSRDGRKRDSKRNSEK